MTMETTVAPQVKKISPQYFAFTVAVLGAGAQAVQIRRCYRASIIADLAAHWEPVGYYTLSEGKLPVPVTPEEIAVLASVLPVTEGLRPRDFADLGPTGLFLAQSAAIEGVTPGAPFTTAALEALFTEAGVSYGQ